MKDIKIHQCKNGNITVSTEDEGVVSKFIGETDEKVKALIALADFLGYEPYEVLNMEALGYDENDKPIKEENI